MGLSRNELDRLIDLITELRALAGAVELARSGADRLDAFERLCSEALGVASDLAHYAAKLGFELQPFLAWVERPRYRTMPVALSNLRLLRAMANVAAEAEQPAAMAVAPMAAPSSEAQPIISHSVATACAAPTYFLHFKRFVIFTTLSEATIRRLMRAAGIRTHRRQQKTPLLDREQMLRILGLGIDVGGSESTRDRCARAMDRLNENPPPGATPRK